jgi:sugar lactone lactonase YvrE
MVIHMMLLAMLVCGAAESGNADGSDIVPPGAVVQKVAGEFGFTEGPAADVEGHVFFTDVPNNRIHRYDIESQRVDVVREQSGGAIGLMFDSLGRLVMCEGQSRRLTRLEGERRVVLAEQYEGKRLNSPNDLVIDEKGGIYFTDPRYGSREDPELPVEAVYYLTPGGELRQVITDLERPYGIILSPDGSRLYVSDHVAQKLVMYEVAEDGSLGEGKDFAPVAGPGRSGPDGMTIDRRGHVYVAGPGGIWVLSPSGSHRLTIETPEEPSNCTFGGAKGRTLYITARTSLYRVQLNAYGLER